MMDIHRTIQEATMSTPAPRPDSPHMADRLRTAWDEGTLILPPQDPDHPLHLPGLSGPVEIALLGTGTTFAAWRLRQMPLGREFLIRIARRAPAQPLRREVAALTLTPRGLGPEPVTLCEDPAASPLGAPYIVTTVVAGRELPPSAWTLDHLRAHARRLAQLHRVLAPGRGPVALSPMGGAPDPWADVDPAPLDLVAELDAVVDAAATAGTVDRCGLGPLAVAARRFCADRADAFADPLPWVLCHGDLCATNILWPGADGLGGRGGGADPGIPDYIDFEWAQADDPARDLAIIGGSVHGGPWYVPMDDGMVDAFLAEYLDARERVTPLVPSSARHAGVEVDEGRTLPALGPVALRTRRDVWEVYEKTAMLLHLAGAAPDRTGTGGITAAALRSTLGARLGI
jgi:aminoglycoside phosphotransferase (APT) family kinase protein